MVLRKLLFLILSILLCSAAGRDFRFDYKYYLDIDGWLKLHVIPATWKDAWQTCELEGSILASPIDPKMTLTMVTHWEAQKSPACGFFTGVHATFSKRSYFSIEGVPLAKMPVRWAAGEPDNANNNEDCIVLTNGTIADVNCSDLFPFMCFRKKTKDMVMTSCGTVDRDYVLNPHTGNCYKFHRQGKSWEGAFRTCAAEGGYLTIVNSNEEALFLKGLHDKHYSEILPGTMEKNLSFIGMHDWGQTGVWRTIHGLKIEQAGYAAWAPRQPDNASPGEHCGAMFRTAMLDDYWCSRTLPFVCEKSPDSLLVD